MERDVIRLECLKLAHNPAHSADETVARAKAYEEYVVGAPERIQEVTSQELVSKEAPSPPKPLDKKQPKDKRHKSDNLDVFS